MSVTAIVNAQLVLESGILFDGAMVIEDGRIKELGSHNELMEKNGIYAALVETQSLL